MDWSAIGKRIRQQREYMGFTREQFAEQDVYKRQTVNLPVNLGIGGAVQTGYLYALENDYDIAVQMDGDGQHDPRDLAALLAPIERGEADLAIGSRFVTGEGFQSTWLRRLGIGILRGAVRLRTRHTVTDPTSGFRAANRRVIELFAHDYAQDYPCLLYTSRCV